MGVPKPAQVVHIVGEPEVGTESGGRTLALFTSFRVLDEAGAVLQVQLDVPVLTQRDLPKA